MEYPLRGGVLHGEGLNPETVSRNLTRLTFGCVRRAAFRRFEELDKLAPDRKQLLTESPGK